MFKDNCGTVVSRRQKRDRDDNVTRRRRGELVEGKSGEKVEVEVSGCSVCECCAVCD